jgi:glucan phosphoethanolaminetransferase (alkaline phosphatase superfamily)
VTDDDYEVRIYEYITYGLGAQYLLRVVIIQFVALLLTYQFARPLSIPVSKPILFMAIYAMISIVFIAITLYFTQNMCRRTLSPQMHNLCSVISSTVLYLGVALVVVFSGYILLIVAVNGPNQVNLLDIMLSILFITALTAILTVGYYDEFDEQLPSHEVLEETIEDWIETTDWVDEDDNSQAQQDRLVEFEENCANLVDIFSDANTEAGKKLAEDIESWISEFDQHQDQSKEIVMGRRKDNKDTDQELQSAHKEFQRLKSILHHMTDKDD